MIEAQRRDGVMIAGALGDIDAANSPSLRDQLAAFVDGETNTLVVDLTGTRYLDSAGIDMLLRLGSLLGERRAMLMLVIPIDSQLTRLAAIVGLPDAMPVHVSVEAALSANAARIASLAAAGGNEQASASGEPAQ